MELIFPAEVLSAGVLFLLSFMIAGVFSECLDNQLQMSFNGTENQCCDTCKPGYGVSVNCSSGIQTVCKTCFPGKTYSSPTYSLSSCKRCSTCGNITHFVLHPCNVTHNTICECPKGSYYDPVADVCEFCDPCPAGLGATRMCTNKHNTECSKCVKNVSFSSKLDPFANCTPCTVCSDTEVMLQACSVTEDTICFSVNAGAGLRPSYNLTEPTDYKDDDVTDGNIIPVYCSALGLVVIGLLGYVIFKHWRRLRAKRRHIKVRDPHDDVEYSKASGADSGVFVENDSPKNYTYSLKSKVRDLPSSKRKEVNKVLATQQSDSWKLLAKELGYNNRKISDIGSRGRHEHSSCFKYLLHDWEKQHIATVGNLFQSLRKIGREDAARVLFIDSSEGRTHLSQNQANNVV